MSSIAYIYELETAFCMLLLTFWLTSFNSWPFGADCCAVAVAGVHDRAVSEGKQLGLDRVEQDSNVTKGPSRCARAAVKEGVAAEHGVEFRNVEATAAG